MCHDGWRFVVGSRPSNQVIGLLANSFLQRRDPAKRLVIDDEALVCLQRYAWPGNIRELRNALDRASLFADDGVIRTRHLPPAITAHAPGLPAAGDQRSLQQMVATFKGTRSELAKYLGLSERTLYRRLREQG